MAKKLPTGPLIAVALVVLTLLWLLTGSNDDAVDDTTSAANSQPSLIPEVQVRTLQAQGVRRSLTINGVTEPDRSVAVASETSGRVLELLKSAGDQVDDGELIARIDPRDLNAQLRTARANLEQARLEYEGAQRLGNQGLQNRSQLAAAEAQFQSAQAQQEALELALRDTQIRAPFSGVLESLDIEVGTFVSPGQIVAQVYDYDPMRVVGEVPETDVNFLSAGQSATVSLVTGEELTGELTFVGTVANPATRTFKVEIAVPSSPKNLAGATAKASIMLDEQQAHYVSPALLNINDAGDMGLKTVTSDNQVEFSPVTIVRSDTGGVWVTGLPSEATLIVVGQGFVNAGDEVKPIAVDGNNLAAGQ